MGFQNIAYYFFLISPLFIKEKITGNVIGHNIYNSILDPARSYQCTLLIH